MARADLPIKIDIQPIEFGKSREKAEGQIFLFAFLKIGRHWRFQYFYLAFLPIEENHDIAES